MDTTSLDDRVESPSTDRRALLQSVCSLRDWIRGVSEWGTPRFGELGSRLGPFRESLAVHFAEGDSGLDRQDASARRSETLSASHRQLLQRLDFLIGSLRAPEPAFCSWQAAVQQVDSLLTEICDDVVQPFSRTH